MNRVINLRSGLPFDVYIGRPGRGLSGPFGNPFIVGRDGPRGTCVALFRNWLFFSTDDPSTEYRRLIRAHIKPTDILACFCAPNPCHGHVIAQYIDAGYCTPADAKPIPSVGTIMSLFPRKAPFS